MQPQLDPNGRDQLKRARRPDDIDVADDNGDTTLARYRGSADALLAARVGAGTGSQPDAPGAEPGHAVTRTEQRRAHTLRVQRVLLALADGESVADIADRERVVPGTVTGWITRHRRHVAVGAIDQDLDRIAVPLAKDNLIHGLIAGDKDYTLETLKGRGHLRRHTQQEGTLTHDLPPLVIRFETPKGIDAPTMKDVTLQGTVVGAVNQPKAIEGTVTRESDADAHAADPGDPV